MLLCKKLYKRFPNIYHCLGKHQKCWAEKHIALNITGKRITGVCLHVLKTVFKCLVNHEGFMLSLMNILRHKAPRAETVVGRMGGECFK